MAFDDFDVHKVKQTLKSLGATQAMLAGHLKIDTSAVSRGLAGKRLFDHFERLGINEYLEQLEEAGGVRREDEATPDRIRVGNLKRHMWQHGLVAEDVAGMAGVSYREFLESLAGVGPPMSDEVMGQLSSALGEDLDAPIGPQTSHVPSRPRNTGRPSRDNTLPQPSPEIPVYLAPTPLPGGLFKLGTAVAESRPAPPWWGKVPEGYGFFCPEYGLAPKFEAGEILFVHPGRSVGPGTYGMAWLRDTEVGIGRIVANEAKGIVLMTGGETIELDRARIRKVHRIAGAWFD